MEHRSIGVRWIACSAVAVIAGCARHDRPAPATQPAAIIGVGDQAAHAPIPSIEEILDNSMEVRLADLKRQVKTGSEDEKFDAIRRLEEMIPFSQGAVDALRFIAQNEEGAVSYTAAVAIEQNETLRGRRVLDQVRVMKMPSPEQLAAAQLLPTRPVDPDAINDIRKFCQQLQSDDANVRADGAESLQLMRVAASDAIPDLMKALLDPSPKVRKAALNAFVAIRQRGEFESMQIDSGEPERLHELCRNVRKMKIEALGLAPLLIFGMGVDDPAARVDAAWALRFLADPGNASVKGDFARLTDPTLRGFMPDSQLEEAPAYLLMVREKALSVIREASASNGDLLGLLLKIAGDDADTEAASAAVEAVANASPEVVASLESFMGKQSLLNVSTIRCLGAVSRHSPRAVDLLISATGSAETMLQREAAQALGAVGDSDSGKRAAPVLTAMLTTSKNASVRLAALRSIAQLGPAAESSAVEVNKLTDGPDEALRSEAIFALSRIAPKTDEAVLAVLRLRGSAGDGAGRTRAIDTLLTLDPPDPGKHLVPALASLLDDPDNALRLKVLRRLAALGVKAKPAAGRVARIIDNNSAELRAAAVNALLAIDPDDQALSAAFVAAVRRKDDFAVEKLAQRVASSDRARDQVIVKLKRIEEADGDGAEQTAARRAIAAISKK